MNYVLADAAVAEVIERLNQVCSEQLKLLLEKKHLYQKVTIDVQGVISEIEGRVYGDDPPMATSKSPTCGQVKIPRATVAE